MSRSHTLTTWADLQKLGWVKEDILALPALQKERPIKDIALNESFAIQEGELCYNTFKRQTLYVANNEETQPEKTVIWGHTARKDGFEAAVVVPSEGIVTDYGYAEVVDNPAIKIGSVVVNFYGLGPDGGVPLKFQYNGNVFSTTPWSKDATKGDKPVSIIPMKMPPGATWRLYLERTTRTSVQEAHVTYGFTDESKIGTYGTPVNGESYMYYNVNECLGNPEGTIKIRAKRTTTTNKLTLVSIGSDDNEEEIALPEAGILDSVSNLREKEGSAPDVAIDIPSA